MRTRGYVAMMSLVLISTVLIAQRPAPQAGSITGTVTTSTPSKLPPLQVNKNQEFCGDQVPSEAVIATSNGQLKNAVVFLEGATPPEELKPTSLTIRNEGCAFVPHVQAGTVKSSLEVNSGDAILHNTHLFLAMGSRDKSLLNLALPGAHSKLDASRATRRPGVVELKCDAHNWMSGYLLLFDHPYYAVTSVNGSFSIGDVPPGTHTIKIWHETFGEITKQVVVEAGKAASLSLEFGG